jgi:uncharacterized membrane protein YkvA (DUF1232 family)
MSEIAKFVLRGAAQITPKILAGVQKKLPMLKLEFAQLQAPRFPHLVEQLEFLANVVEDYMDGEDPDLPLYAVASATFALIYAHRQMDLIPDSIVEFGHADDSSVVRAVLMENERVFEKYAARHGVSWSRVTLKP